jgi:hypothetical protein
MSNTWSLRLGVPSIWWLTCPGSSGAFLMSTTARRLNSRCRDAAGADRQRCRMDRQISLVGAVLETDCLPGHIGLEPANPSASYLIGFT